MQKKQRLQMPDEYLPPNNVLFLQNLPEGTTSDDLREVFELYVTAPSREHHADGRRHAGLVEIRTIPAKKDIAFVEYADEAAATVAKEALHNFKIDGETKMKVRPPSRVRSKADKPGHVRAKIMHVMYREGRAQKAIKHKHKDIDVQMCRPGQVGGRFEKTLDRQIYWTSVSSLISAGVAEDCTSGSSRGCI